MNEKLRTATDLHPNVKYIKDNFPLLFDAIVRRCDTNIKFHTNVDGFFILNQQERHFWWAVVNGDWNKAKEMRPEYFLPQHEYKIGDVVYAWYDDTSMAEQCTFVAKIGEKYLCAFDDGDVLRAYEDCEGFEGSMLFYKNVSAECPVEEEREEEEYEVRILIRRV